MKLGINTLKKLTYGALSFRCEGGYFRPLRFSPKQVEYMFSDKFDRGYTNWAMHTGAIRLEFKTTATKISFDFKSESWINESNTVDFIVDGFLSAVYRVDKTPKGHIEHFMAEGEKHVCICLPCIASFYIKNFTINGTYKSVKRRGQRVLILGDSITHGGGVLMSSATYANRLALKTSYDVVAQGIAGYRYEARKEMMKPENFDPDKIIVFMGTNCYESDHIKRGYDYKQSVSDFYDLLVSLYPDTPILCVTPIWRGDEVDWTRFTWCINTIKDECARKNIPVLDGLTIVPHANECFADKIHPTAYASVFIADAFEKALKKL